MIDPTTFIPTLSAIVANAERSPELTAISLDLNLENPTRDELEHELNVALADLVLRNLAQPHPSLPPPPDVPLADISWRIDSRPGRPNWTNREQTKGTASARYISYIGRRAIERVLNDWVGPINWRTSYEPGQLPLADGTPRPVLWCHLSVREHPDAEWVTKSDIGVPNPSDNTGARDSNNTVLKGLVSDSLKRAAAAWGIGHAAYALPVIWGPVNIWRTNANSDKIKSAPADNYLDVIRHELRKAGYTDADTIPDQPVETRDDDGAVVEAAYSSDPTISLKQHIWDLIRHSFPDGDKGKEACAQAAADWFTWGVDAVAPDLGDDPLTADQAAAALEAITTQWAAVAKS